ncbi:MAG: UDP-N-acetylmuramoyl-L-alanine--D-glutamate ligase [Hyphomicrobiales bacterium]
MIWAEPYGGKRIAVFGLGKSGLSTVHALVQAGADVAPWDDSEASRETATRADVHLVDLNTADWSQFDALILAPGVPLTHPEPHWTVVEAHKANIPIIGDTEVFAQTITASGLSTKLVGITGTNGKSTTTALIGHMFASAGRDTQTGGNIGLAVLDMAPPENGRHYVVEFSSYQIDLTPSLKPDVGILLNLTPDHLDRHGDMKNYAEVKARMFALQDEADEAFIGVDDEYCREIAADVSSARVARVSVEGHDAEISVTDGMLSDARDGSTLDLTGFDTLRGRHNWQNAAMAWGAGRSLGLTADEIAAAFTSFPGLAHRMEIVARRGNVLFVNDSKATNVDAAERALDTFDKIFWIAGGLAKTGGLELLRPYFGNICHAFLIGDSAADFANSLGDDVPHSNCETIEQAVCDAADAAANFDGECVVLLSPACASFDQFRNFELRGNAFKKCVAALSGVHLMNKEAA